MRGTESGAEFATVYGWVQKTREGLLAFLAGVPWEAMTRGLPDVGHGSIRGLVLHAAGCYRFWLEGFAGGRPPASRDDAAFGSLDAIRAELAAVDGVVADFIRERGEAADDPMTRPMPRSSKPFTASPRWLFTHVTTHEFHHKGQVVMLCRRLGFPPVETDLWEPRWDGP